MPPSEIELVEVTRSHGPGSLALDGVSLRVAAGERLAVLGPSGSGKTTLLRLMAGLETAQVGMVRMDGMDVSQTAPHERDVAMVFQNPAVYPHLSVFDNLAFGLKARGVAREERDRRVREVAEVLGVDRLLDRRPGAISGGERQRVALGRAVVRQPRLLLLDEPFSSLDAPLRTSLRGELLALHRRFGSTMVLVTHDASEAMSLGQRLAVLDQGRVIQHGTPQELHDRPAHRFIASFLGSPGMNLLRCEVRRDGRENRAVLGIRPERIGIAKPDEAAPPTVIDAELRVPGVVSRVEFQGHFTLATIRVGSQTLAARLTERTDLSPDQPVLAVFALADASWFDPDTGRRMELDCQPAVQAIA